MSYSTSAPYGTSPGESMPAPMSTPANNQETERGLFGPSHGGEGHLRDKGAKFVKKMAEKQLNKFVQKQAMKNSEQNLQDQFMDPNQYAGQDQSAAAGAGGSDGGSGWMGLDGGSGWTGGDGGSSGWFSSSSWTGGDGGASAWSGGDGGAGAALC